MFNKIDKIKLDNYFNELAKIYKRKSHGYIFEFILVGGASILINYDFRDITNDIDADFLPSADIKESIIKVSKKFHMSANWINNDFKNTKSYSKKLAEFSTFYKTFMGIISVRTIKDEYLIAMKLMSGRKYKNDISDIVGILSASNANGKNITFDMIDTAVNNLYNGWDNISKDIIEILDTILHTKNLSKLYNEIRNEETKTHDQLVEFDNNYKGKINQSNINDILNMLNKKS